MTVRGLGGQQYARPWLLLCEGPGDKRVFHEVITCDPRLHDKFDVRYPRLEGMGSSGGRGKFGKWLSNQPIVSPSFRRFIKGVVIISDADANRDASLHEVFVGLERNGLPVPQAEGIVAQEASFAARVVVYLVPHDRSGSIETLCAEALQEQWNLERQISEFLQQTPASVWVATKAGKSRLHVAMAVTCEDKPDTTLSGLFQEDQRYHVPAGHRVFDDLRDKLAALPDLSPTTCTA